MLLLALQGAFYGLALLGIALPERLGRHWLFYIPAYFFATNWGALQGLLHFLSGRRHRVWAAAQQGLAAASSRVPGSGSERSRTGGSASGGFPPLLPPALPGYPARTPSPGYS